MTIDLNTLINSATFALLCWTLYTVHGLSRDQAAANEKEKAQDDQIKQVRARVIAVEGKVTDLQLDLAAFEPSKPRRARHE